MFVQLFQYLPIETMLFLLVLIVLGLKINDKTDNNSYGSILVIGLFIIMPIAYLIGINGNLFGNMVQVNSVNFFEKLILVFATALITIQANDWLSKHAHAAEYTILILVSLIGMCLMLSAGNMLIFYLGLEMASIPVAALATFDLHKQESGEAGVKLILSSAFASGMLLFGLSWVYGSSGTLDIAQISAHSGKILSMAQTWGLILVFSGFAFKISAVPFHFWTADVYQGSPLSITAYLAMVSKAAMAFVFISILAPLFIQLPQVWVAMVSITVALTIFIGNMFALRQTSIKRFLAFSSIAQVGFILLALILPSEQSVVSIIYFVIIYLFSSLGIFGVATWLESNGAKSNLSVFKGFYHEHKFMSWVMAICLFSLAGIPPTAGFFGKFFLIGSGMNNSNFYLILFVALNMVVSLYYYLKIVKYMFMDSPLEVIEVKPIPLTLKITLILSMIAVISLGVSSNLYNFIQQLL
jgi:NADH-quinone oxidoreductase subunit N